jgi:alkylation response protein AidB-like acyl-CoA dehydrogenase
LHLHDSPEDRSFRLELREWLVDAVASLPAMPHPDDWSARREFDANWQGMLFDAGYAGMNWPVEYGGRGATVTQHLIFLEECVAARAPDIGVNTLFVSLFHAGPTLIAEGTPEQRAFHLPRILRGESVWCQGFSEPNAGSDLASLRTIAVEDGDEFVVTGQKIWTSRAQVSDYCELLVRTDPAAPKHKGISWLIMPMDTPGVEVRPLRTIEDRREFNELILDQVRIPKENLVGAVNDGWRVTHVTFGFERGTASIADMLERAALVRDLAALAQQLTRDGEPLWSDPGIRREIGFVAAEFDALWALTKRNLSQAKEGPVSVSGASAFKLAFAEAMHRLGDLSLRLLGSAGRSLGDVDSLSSGRLAHVELWAFALSIGAGTSQIQRKIIAERVLGLPREDRGASRS